MIMVIHGLMILLYTLKQAMNHSCTFLKTRMVFFFGKTF